MEFQPQGLSEARQAESFGKFSVTNTPQERPVGDGGTHHIRWIDK
jgi:hypothetical protein